MKKILLILGFCCSVNMLSAQENIHIFQDSHHNFIGDVGNGTIIGNNNTFLGQFKNVDKQFCIVNSQHKTVGYIANGNEIHDLDHHVIASISMNQTDYTITVENGDHVVLGYIKRDGSVENASHTVIGYELLCEPMYVVAYFLVFKL